MAKVTEDDRYYWVEFEDEGWVYATVGVRKPCSLRELYPRAEAFLLRPVKGIIPLQRTHEEALLEEVVAPQDHPLLKVGL